MKKNNSLIKRKDESLVMGLVNASWYIALPFRMAYRIIRKREMKSIFSLAVPVENKNFDYYLGFFTQGLIVGITYLSTGIHVFNLIFP